MHKVGTPWDTAPGLQANFTRKATPMSAPYSLGIDVAHQTLACCLLGDGTRHRCDLPNTPAGFRRLARWLDTHTASQPVQITLEATGGYELAVATFLHAQGSRVCVVNPYGVKRFAESGLCRTKTDAVDAETLAEYGRAHPALHPWQPPTPAQAELQALVRARADLEQAIHNRCHAPGTPASVRRVYDPVLASQQAAIDDLDRQIHALLHATPTLGEDYRLLRSIIGIGHSTAVTLLAEGGDLRRFASGKALAAFAGLSVQEGTSGTSVHRRPRLSKRGSARLRKALYFPAITAMRWNPHLRAFAERLAARGKTKMQIIGAVMRKLLELVYAILHTGQPFQRDYRCARLDRHPVPAGDGAVGVKPPLGPDTPGLDAHRAVA